MLASGSRDNTIKIWDTRSRGAQLRSRHSQSVWSVAWKGPMLASGSRDATIKIWDTESGRCVATLKGHSSYVNSVAWNGPMLASGSRDNTIKIWTLLTEEDKKFLDAARVVTRRVPQALFRHHVAPLLMWQSALKEDIVRGT